MSDHSELIEALKWYEVNVRGCRKIGLEGDSFRHALDRDGGEKARVALAGVTTEESA